MARTQFSLAQVSGSARELITEVGNYIAPVASLALTGSDMQDLFGALAASVQRIHGKASNEVFNQAEGTFDTVVFDVNAAGAVTLDSSAGTISIGADDIDQAINIGTDGTRTITIGEAADSTVSVKSRGGTLLLDGTGQTVDLNSAALDIDASAAVNIDAGAASEIATSAGTLTLDGAAGVVIQEGNATVLEISTDRDITSTNTRQIHLDASGVVNLNSSAGVISIGNDDIDQNINIGTYGTRTITIGEAADSTVSVKSLGGTLLLDGTGQTVDLNSAALDVDTSGAVNINAAGNASDISLITAHVAGVAFHIDADANAGSIVDIDAGILQIDATGVAGINSGGTLSLGTANSAVAVNIGHATSEVTIGDNLTVTGDLTVQGDTVTVNVATLSVEDKNIHLAKGATGTGARGAGLDFELGGDVDAGYIRVGSSDDTIFELRAPGNDFDLTLDINASKTITVEGALTIEADSVINQDLSTDAAVAFASVTANGGVVADNLTLDGTSLALSSGDLVVDSAAGSATLDGHTGVIVASSNSGDILLDSAADIILDAAGNDVFFKSAGTTIGTITNSSSDLVIKQDVNAKDIIFQQDDGNEIVRLGNDRRLYFFDKGGEHISGDGNVLNISGDDIILDAGEAVTLDTGDGQVSLAVGGSVVGEIGMVSNDLYLSSSVANKDMVFMVNDGGTMTEVMRLDGDVSALRMGTGKFLQLGPVSQGSLGSDGTNAQFTSTGILKLESTLDNTGAIYLRANGGTSETIKLQADQGSGVESILLTSDVGGVKLAGGLDSAVAVHIDASPNGGGVTITGGDQNDSIFFENSPLKIENIAAPSDTDNKLYSVNNQLYHDSYLLLSASGGRQKVSAVITGTVPAGSTLDQPGFAFGGGGNNNTVDIFVNGQLMSSGSGGDYEAGGSLNTSMNFKFVLEADDVVTFVKNPL